MDTFDRIAWRGYAQAALTGFLANERMTEDLVKSIDQNGNREDQRDFFVRIVARRAELHATAMLTAERARFAGEGLDDRGGSIAVAPETVEKGNAAAKPWTDPAVPAAERADEELAREMLAEWWRGSPEDTIQCTWRRVAARARALLTREQVIVMPKLKTFEPNGSGETTMYRGGFNNALDAVRRANPAATFVEGGE